MQKFHTIQYRTVTDKVPYTFEKFEGAIIHNKPKALFNGEWTNRKPFILITEYNELGIKWFCNASTTENKVPKQTTIEELYNFLKYQGLDETYLHEDKELEAAIIEMGEVPYRCRVTGRSFFGFLKGRGGNYVPTYGGPNDSFTLAVKVDDEDDPHAYNCQRFDHDLGAWVGDEDFSLAPEDPNL